MELDRSGRTRLSFGALAFPGGAAACGLMCAHPDDARTTA
jgi:hypothetical protein